MTIKLEIVCNDCMLGFRKALFAIQFYEIGAVTFTRLRQKPSTIKIKFLVNREKQDFLNTAKGYNKYFKVVENAH